MANLPKTSRPFSTPSTLFDHAIRWDGTRLHNTALTSDSHDQNQDNTIITDDAVARNDILFGNMADGVYTAGMDDATVVSDYYAGDSGNSGDSSVATLPHNDTGVAQVFKQLRDIFNPTRFADVVVNNAVKDGLLLLPLLAAAQPLPLVSALVAAKLALPIFGRASSAATGRASSAATGRASPAATGEGLLAMGIRTAGDMGLDTLNGELHDKRLARRILALAGRGIQVSEGVIELLAEGTRERLILDAVLMSEELKEAGGSITQTGLEEMIVRKILELFPQEVEGKDFTSKSPLSDVRKALNLDLPIKVKVEDVIVPGEAKPSSLSSEIIDIEVEAVAKVVVIATEDEVDAERGMALVLVREQQALTDPRTILATDEARQILHDLIREKATQIWKDLLDLPTIANPAEFEAKLKSLALVMTERGERESFIRAATKAFADRPARSRRAIAEVMKNYGFDPDLMDNIVFLSSDRAAHLQIEAINVVIRSMTSSTDPAEIEMAAAALLKVLEEDARVEVRKKALEGLAKKAELIQERLPQFFAEGRIVQKAKTLLIESPADYRPVVEYLLFAFGRREPELIIAKLKNDLDVITDPYVLTTYFVVLEGLSTDLQEKKDMAAMRWRLAFENREGRPQLLAESEERLRLGLPDSLDLLFNIFSPFPAGDQVYFVGLLDRNFHDAVASSNLDVATAIATYFQNLILEEEAEDETELAILKTGTVISASLPQTYHQKIWKRMQERLGELFRDNDFVERFAAAGDVLFPETVNLLGRTTNQAAMTMLAKITYRKLSAVGEKKQALVKAAGDLVTVTAESLAGKRSGIPLDVLNAGTKVIVSSPFATADIVHELSGASIAAGAKAGPRQIAAAYSIFEPSPLFEGRSVQLFADAFLNLTDTDPGIAFDGIRIIFTANSMTGDMLFKIFVEMRKKAAANQALKSHLPKTYAALAASRHLKPEIAEFLLDAFLDAIQSDIPDPPNAFGFVPEVPQATRLALSGLVNLTGSGRLDDKQKGRATQVLERLIGARPQKVMKQFVKGVPPEEVPDPFKDALQYTLSQIR